MRAGAVRVALTEDWSRPLPLTSSFTTQAGKALITVSGTGWRWSADDHPIGCIEVVVDGLVATHLCLYFNVYGQHLALPSKTFVRTMTAGPHTIRLNAGSLASNSDDSYAITVLEIPS